MPRFTTWGAAVLGLTLLFSFTGPLRASAPAGAKAYVTNTDDNQVSVIDLASMSVIATIDVGMQPQHPCASPDGSRVFVPNLAGSPFPTKGGPKGGPPIRPSVSVIDTSTDSVIATIPLTRNGPFDCVVTPDGAKLYVSCRIGVAVSVVDLVSLTEIKAIDLPSEGGSPEGIAVTPDGAKVYVVDNGYSWVNVINTATDAVVGEPISVGPGPHDVKFTADGTKAFVVGDSDPHIILTATDTVSATVLNDIGDQRNVAISGNTAYVTNSVLLPPAKGPKSIGIFPTIDVYDLSTEAYVESIDLFSSTPWGIDVLRDGSFAYPVTRGAHDVREVDLVQKEDTDDGINVGNNPTGIVVVQPRPVVNSFFLPKKVTYKKNAATPAKSTLKVNGFFDTGSQVVDLAAAATLTVGTVDIAVPGLTASKNGRTFTFQQGGLQFVIAKNPFGSSRAKFRLTNKGDLGPSVPTDGNLTLRFRNAVVDGECEVLLQGGGFQLGKKRGALSKPNVFIVRSHVEVHGAGKDELTIIVGLATNGVTPPQAEEVRVEFGSVLKATVPASQFVRQGDQYVFKGNVDGITNVNLDYVRETIEIVGKNLDIGNFPEGQSPLTIFIGVGPDDRGVAVRISRDGDLLKY